MALLYVLGIISRKGLEAPPCNVMPVKRGDISSQISGRGKIVPNRMVNLKSRKIGTIQEILVKEGEQVVKGQQLVRIEPDSRFTFEINRIRDKLYEVRQNKKIFEKQLKTDRKLYDEGLIALRKVEESKKVLSQVTTKENLLTMQLEVIEKEIGQKISDFINEDSYSKEIHIYIRAPFSGTILNINRHPGETVTPVISPEHYMKSNGILILADLSEYLVEHKVSEIDIDKIQTGKEDEIWLESFPNRVYHGVVHTISSISTTPNMIGQREKNGLSYFDIKILIKDAGPELKIGMSCRVSIHIEKKNDVLLAPIETVAKDEKGAFVYVMESQAITRQDVTTGLSDENNIEIISGLSEEALLCDKPLAFMELQEFRQMEEARSTMEKLLK
jgi:HlyD family secretion protein